MFFVLFSIHTAMTLQMQLFSGNCSLVADIPQRIKLFMLVYSNTNSCYHEDLLLNSLPLNWKLTQSKIITF